MIHQVHHGIGNFPSENITRKQDAVSLALSCSQRSLVSFSMSCQATLPSDVSSDATAYSVSETAKQWTGAIKLSFCSTNIAEMYRCGDKEKILKGIQKALEKKDTQPPYLNSSFVCSVNVEEDTFTVILAFKSKQSCIDFLENDKKTADQNEH
ncbi:uncharacterized protein LOC144350478 [Saccoglossus kowalevskii]